MFTTTEVKTFVKRWFHDVCGGEYLPTGVTFMSNPPQYRHECSLCGDTSSSQYTYPYQYCE